MDKAQVARNLERMEAGVIKTDHSAKLDRPEIERRIHSIKAGTDVSLQVCKALGVPQSDGLSGASIKTLLAIVKEVTGSTKAILATDEEAAQASRILNIKRALARQAFAGRSLRHIEYMTRWLLQRRHEDDFDVVERLGGWIAEQEHKEWAARLTENAENAYSEAVLDGLREMD